MSEHFPAAQTELLPDPDQWANDAAPVDLAELSHANIAQIRADYIAASLEKGQFNDLQTAEAAIDERSEQVRRHHMLTVNMSAAGIGRLMQAGRLETYWDHRRALTEDGQETAAASNRKDIHDHYDTMRLAAEQGLARYAGRELPPSGPVYAAVASQQDIETGAGAAPSYGNWWVALDPKLEAAAVYSFGDSHASVTLTDSDAEFTESAILDQEAALEAKAIVDLVDEYHRGQRFMLIGSLAVGDNEGQIMSVGDKRPAYVESIIFDEVGVDRVVSINARIANNAQLAELGSVLRDHPEVAGRLRASLQLDLPALTKDWLKQHFPDNVKLKIENEATESDEVTPAWDALGVSSDASYGEVAEALQTKAQALHRRVARRSGMPGAKMPQFLNDGQWQGYMRSLQSDLSKAQGRVAEDIAELIVLQQERVFFASATA